MSLVLLPPPSWLPCSFQVNTKGSSPTMQELPDPVLDADVQQAFDTAFANIKMFHEAQKAVTLDVETMPGVRCRRIARPIEAVGLYVPGGTAVLPSSALMLCVPAAIAGCKTIVLATPPRPDGSVTPEVLYCAKKAGATHVLKVGGAQAVAAMAWGTETCPKVGVADATVWQRLLLLPPSDGKRHQSFSLVTCRLTRSWALATSTSRQPRCCCRTARP